MCCVIHLLTIYSKKFPHMLQKKTTRLTCSWIFSTLFWKKYITLILTLLEWVWQQTRPIFTLNGWDEGHMSTIKRWVLKILNDLVFWLHIHICSFFSLYFYSFQSVITILCLLALFCSFEVMMRKVSQFWPQVDLTASDF